MNMSQMMNEFIKYYASESENTAKSYARSVREYIAFTMNYTGWSLDELIEQSNKRNILMFVAMLNERGLSPYSVNVYTSGVETFYKFLVEFDYREKENPVNNVRRQNTKGVEQHQPYIEESDFKKLIGATQIKSAKTKKFPFVSARDKFLYTLNLTTGLRGSESLNLKIEQFESDIITIKGKGNKLRKVRLTQEIRECYNEYMKVRHMAFENGTEDEGWVFVTINGNQLSLKDFNKNLKRNLEKVGLSTDMASHGLRRSCVTKYLNDGVPIQQVARLVGHSSTSTTMRYYKADGSEFDFMGI